MRERRTPLVLPDDDHNRDRLSQEAVARARALAAEIIAGRIQVPFE